MSLHLRRLFRNLLGSQWGQNPDLPAFVVRRCSMRLVLSFIAALLLPAPLEGQGLGILAGVEPSIASEGQQVSVQGAVYFLQDPGGIPLVVSEAVFVTHHGSGIRTTPNLLPAPVTLSWWDYWLEVTTNITIQAGDPRNLRIDFAITCSFGPDGAGGFTCLFPTQVVIKEPVQPTLQLTLGGPGTLAVAWPVQFRDWRLESTTDLAHPWAPFDMDVVTTNESCQVHLPITTGERRFFRLSR